jgi:hypothetical protein
VARIRTQRAGCRWCQIVFWPQAPLSWTNYRHRSASVMYCKLRSLDR